MYVGRVESRVTGKAKYTIFRILKSSFLELGRPFKVTKNHIENIGNSIFHVQYGFTYRIQYSIIFPVPFVNSTKITKAFHFD